MRRASLEWGIALRFDVFHDRNPERTWGELLADCTGQFSSYPDLEVIDPKSGASVNDEVPATGIFDMRFPKSKRLLEMELFLMRSNEYTSQAGGLLSGLPTESLSQRHRDRIEAWKSQRFHWLGVRLGGSWKLETPLLFSFAWSFAQHVDGIIHLDYDQLQEGVPQGLHDPDTFWRAALNLWTTRTGPRLPWRIFERS